MSQKHELSPDPVPEAGPVAKKAKTSDDIDLALAASILYECWAEGMASVFDKDKFFSCLEASDRKVKIEPSSDVRMPVDGDQDRVYVTGLVKFDTFSSAMKAHPLDVFYIWYPDEGDCDEWRTRSSATRPLEQVSDEYLWMMWSVMGNREERTPKGAAIRRRLWDIGLCACPDPCIFTDVTGTVYVVIMVRDSVAKKLNDDCPGSFAPFHAN
jgi:hypothetical protein